MNVTLRQLRVFLAVARAHSFSRAGDTIGLTQPAVSRSISELEGELGLKLLDRTTREVVRRKRRLHPFRGVGVFGQHEAVDFIERLVRH